MRSHRFVTPRGLRRLRDVFPSYARAACRRPTPRDSGRFPGRLAVRRAAGVRPVFQPAVLKALGFSRILTMFTLDEAVTFASELRATGKTIVFTNGVFDLLHPGHLRYLQYARSLGDALIVGVNSDRSVRAVKGPGRPIIPDMERAEILAALACVDAVAIFDEETPFEIISAIQPDVLVKGADWAENAIVGRDIVEARGGKVVRAAIEEGYSTTSIVERVRAEKT